LKAKGEGRREKGEGRRAKGEGRREKGEGQREKGRIQDVYPPHAVRRVYPPYWIFVIRNWKFEIHFVGRERPTYFGHMGKKAGRSFSAA